MSVLGHGLVKSEVYVLEQFSHSVYSPVVDLDHDRGFFFGFAVSTLYSCVVIAFFYFLYAGFSQHSGTHSKWIGFLY